MQVRFVSRMLVGFLLYSLLVLQSSAQSQVSGVITDETGEPMIGVSVVEKGTTNGTITDIDGRFTLSVAQGVILQFSFVGYKTQEIVFSGQTTFNIQLAEDVLAMDELVIVAYGAVKKQDLTGSVSVLGSENLKYEPAIRVEGILQSRLAGVIVNQNSGNPGEAMKVRIRGANSYAGSNAPLYVIDGFIGGDIQSLNPSDIENISVLKDASATTLYGSQGANGVILITTKRGKPNVTKVELKYNQSYSQIRKQWDLMEGWEYMQTRNEKLLAEGTPEANLPFTRQEILLAQSEGTGTNWQEQIFQTGVQKQLQVSATKGNFYFSGAAQTFTGIVKGTQYNRYNIRFTYTEKLWDPVKLFVSVSDGFEDRTNADQTDLLSIIEAANGWPTNLPVIDPATGDYTRNQAYGTLALNPMYTIKERTDRALRNDFLINSFLEFDLIKGLKFKTQGGINLQGVSSTSFNRVNPNEVATNPDNSSYGNNNRMNFNWQTTQQLTYQKEMGIHQFEVSALYEVLSRAERQFNAAGNDLSTTDLDYYSAPVAGFQSNGSSKENAELSSLFGRINYTLDDKYLFTFNVRHDRSSRLGDGYEGATFFGGAFAYRMSEEPFMQSLGIVDELKLRMSAGQVGSQSVGFTQTVELVGYNIGYSYDGTTNVRGAILPAPRNPKIRWEVTNQADLGVDVGLWEGRVNFTADVFYKRTVDLHFSRPIPAYLGGGTIIVNSGAMVNKGFEFSANGYVIDQGDFSIEASGNFTIVRNELVEIIGNSDYIVSGLNPSTEPDLLDNSHRNFVGRPMGLLWGLNYQGVYSTEEAAEAATYNRSPGDAKFEDKNNDGVINNEDMMVIGNPNPDFVWGFTTNVNYKNWTLNLVWNGVHGVDVLNSVKYLTYGGARDATNRDVLNRWTPENQNSNIPGYTTTSVLVRQSDQWIEDGSYVKLRNVTLNYEVPLKALSIERGISSLNAYVTVQNALVFTKYSGYDPESLSNTADRAGGFDQGGYPIPRTFIFGLAMGF